MKTRSQIHAAIGAFALAVAAIPLTAVVSPAVSQAQENCDYNFFYNTVTNQCQFCETPVMYWNPELNLCLVADPTPYVDPILGPAGPVGVGPNPVVGPVGPVGPVGVGGVGPVVGPVGPAGVGGVGPVVGPVGPIGVGR